MAKKPHKNKKEIALPKHELVQPQAKNVFFSQVTPHSPIVKIIIFLFSFFLYAQTISYDYTLDDPISTTQNKYVQQGLKGIPVLMTKAYMYGGANVNHGSYRPLPLVSFALEYSLFGNNTVVSHFINVLLYAITCFLLYLLLLKLLFSIHQWLALLVIIFYITHPVHTEVVASIKSRDEIMALFFIVNAGLFYFKYEHKKIVAWLCLFFFFFLAMLSKENALTFIVAFPLMLYFFKKYSVKKVLFSSLPILFAGIIYIGIRAIFLDRIAGDTSTLDPINNVLYAAESISEKYATALFIVFRYILICFFPHPLSWDYSYNQIPVTGFSDPTVLFSVAVLALMIYLGVHSLKTRNIYGFCFLFFFTTISIVSNLFVDVGSTLGERFLFIPSLAFCIGISHLILSKVNKNDKHKVNSNSKLIVAVIAVFFIGKTIARNQVWQDNRMLFTSGIETAPNSARANFCLGYDYFANGLKEENRNRANNDIREGILYMQNAVKIFPKYVDAYKNIGLAYYEIKEYENAIVYLKTANAYTKTEDALFYTGLSYGFLKNADSAFVFLDECVKKNPKYPRINYFKGLILSDVADVTLDSSMRNKILVKSLIYFDKAILENPKDWETHVQSGYCYGKMNNFKKAIPALIKGTSLNPKNFQALLFIGIGFGMQQKSDSALIYFEKAKQIEPTNVEVYKNIAITFKTKNNYKKALESIKEGLIYQPSNEILIQLQNEILAIQNSVK